MRVIDTLSNLRRPRGVRGLLDSAGRELAVKYYANRGQEGGVDIMAEDWDTLIILDGCRYDTFEELVPFDGSLESRRSPATESSGYLREQFVGRELHDTVYITANPHARIIPEGTFHRLINELDRSWSSELKTVPPGAMTSSLVDALDSYPDKRIIAHYMQPHFPFIGPTGRQIDGGGIGDDGAGKTQIWHRLQYGEGGLSVNAVKQAYRENLQLAFESIGRVLEGLSGKTVITSDHGNLIGDRLWPVPMRGYGHPPGLYTDELVTVPWFEVDGSGRRQIESSSPDDDEVRLTEASVEDRLEALGYA